jgi:Rrf2 family protein
MLGKSTKYAIRALVFIQLRNQSHRRPGVLEIAREIGSPPAYTAKIMQCLTRNKLVDSMKGRGGGLFFGNTKQLSIYDVVQVMEGDRCFHSCGFGLMSCDTSNPCPLHDKYTVIRDGFYNLVKTETIQSLSEKISDGNAVIKSLVGNQ